MARMDEVGRISTLLVDAWEAHFLHGNTVKADADLQTVQEWLDQTSDDDLPEPYPTATIVQSDNRFEIHTNHGGTVREVWQNKINRVRASIDDDRD